MPQTLPPGTMCLADHTKRIIRTLSPSTVCLADHTKLVRMVAFLVAARTRPLAFVALHAWPLFSCDPSLTPP